MDHRGLKVLKVLSDFKVAKDYLDLQVMEVPQVLKEKFKALKD